MDATVCAVQVAPSVLFSITYSLTDPDAADQLIPIAVFAGTRLITPTAPGAAGTVVAVADVLAVPVPTAFIAETR